MPHGRREEDAMKLSRSRLLSLAIAVLVVVAGSLVALRLAHSTATVRGELQLPKLAAQQGDADALGGDGGEEESHPPVAYTGITANGIPSTEFWQTRLRQEFGEDHPLSAPVGNVVYQGNTDQKFLRLTRQASHLHRTGHRWHNVGPYKGIKDIPGTGSGAELLGSVGGIGTAMAVDPHDKSGKTVYLGTIGGLYKTTNGGKTVHNITEHKVPREAIGAIAIDPRHHKTIYIGTGVSIFTLSDDAAGTGVYVSHNGGKSWHRPKHNTHGYGVNSIAVNPHNGTVLAGTTYGLWRSTNRGKAFRQVRLPDQAKFPLGNWLASIAYNPHHAREVTVDVGYAFGKKKYGKHVLAPGNGLYRSKNNGRTFHRMPSNSQLTQPAVSGDPLGRTSLSYSTAHGGKNILWALVQDAGRAAGEHVVVDNPVLPANVDGNTELNGLYRSSDDGKTWKVQATAQSLVGALNSTTSGAAYPLSYAAGVQADYNQWVLADPKDPNRVYFGLEEAFSGEYHGTASSSQQLSSTFVAIEKYANACGFLSYFNTIPNNNGVACPSPVPGYGGGTTHPDQHSAAITLTRHGVRLYSGNDGGWWAQNAHTVSDSTGAAYQGYDNSSWTSLNKPATVLPWDVTTLQDGSSLLALQDNGVAHVKRNGKAYQVCGGDGVYVYPGPNAHSYYCGIDGQTILGTKDDFKHTIDVTPREVAEGATFLSPWAVDRSNPKHLIAAAGNVDESTGGMNSNTYDPSGEEIVSSTWKTVLTPPKPPHDTWDSTAVFTRGRTSYAALCSICRPSLATGTANTPRQVTTRIATNVKGHCKRKVAGKKCWHLAKSKGLPHEQISDIAVDLHHPKTLYVGLRQMILLGADPHLTGAQKVMVSHNGGRTFHNLTGNLPRTDVHRLILRRGHLYAASEVGVFTAKAGSRHWKRLGSGLPEVTFRSMRLSLDGRSLLAGAYGRGGWVYRFPHKAKA
jgi:photosystem II stability/assembly factor-like uncharacterized protein